MSVQSVLEGYLATVAATMTAPACTTVWGGEPDNVNTPAVAYWFLGTRTWEANTLTRTQELEGWRIRLYLPLAARFTPDARIAEAWVVAFSNGIRAQLYGHIGAGGANTGQGMELTDALPGYWQVPTGTICRTVTMDWWAQLTDVHPIAV